MTEFQVGDTVEVISSSSMKGLRGLVVEGPSSSNSGMVRISLPDQGVMYFADHELKLIERPDPDASLDTLVRRYAEALDKIVEAGTYSAPYTGLGIFYEFLREAKEL